MLTGADWALAHRRVVLISAVTMLGLISMLFPFLGGEFIPILNEAAITPQTIRLPSISLEKSIEIELEMQRAVMEFLIRMVVSKIGRSELGNDPQEPNASDPVVSLKPMDEWTTAKTKPELDDAVRRRIERVPRRIFCSVRPFNSGWMNCCLVCARKRRSRSSEKTSNNFGRRPNRFRPSWLESAASKTYASSNCSDRPTSLSTSTGGRSPDTDQRRAHQGNHLDGHRRGGRDTCL